MVVKDFNIKGVDERSIVYYYNKATERKGQMLTWKYSFPGSAADFKDVRYSNDTSYGWWHLDTTGKWSLFVRRY
ncbi:hypothetical protein L917_19711 [Phytophthora nicotianae]|uniref:Uncharacterized protein n=1 Tax=Phytophthora nicotianae TaxID=4792 RepID=W2K3J3_PHYNI|nr:hypothetical protein L917_19711 [Phytophthora nicotianae]